MLWNKTLHQLAECKFGKSMKLNTPWPLEEIEGQSWFEVEPVWALEAFCSTWSKNIHADEKWKEKHCITNKQKLEWIEAYVERETTWARTWVEDPETAIQQEQEDIRTDERWDRLPNSLKKQLRRCLLVSEILSVIMRVQAMRRIGIISMAESKQSWACWA